MDRGNAAAHRRLLILVLLALAAAATLAAAVPSAYAGRGSARSGLGHSVSLRVSLTRDVVKVAGEVTPVELVGQYVTIAVEKKSRKGKWAEVISSRAQVDFDPPASWSGRWDTRQDSTGTAYARVGTIADWRGTVLFEHPAPNLKGHYVDYEMTFAAGTSTYEGISYDGEGKAASLYEYAGQPLVSAGSRANIGSLRWYFADSPDGIGIDSYEGASFHQTEGFLTVTDLVDSPPVVAKVPAYMTDSDSMWRAGSAGPRPILQVDARMKEKLVRPGTLANGPGETVTMASEWDLAPSQTIDSPSLREGNYVGQITIAKPGDYRVRAEIDGVASKWVTLKVK